MRLCIGLEFLFDVIDPVIVSDEVFTLIVVLSFDF